MSMPATGKKKFIVIPFADQQTRAASRMISAGVHSLNRPASVHAGRNARAMSSLFDDVIIVHRGEANRRGSIVLNWLDELKQRAPAPQKNFPFSLLLIPL